MVSPVAKRKAKKERPTWDFGRKLERWLREQVAAKRHPQNAVEMAERVGVTKAAVWFWINWGATPRVSTASKVAKVMGVDVRWLTDDTRDWDDRDRTTEDVVTWSRIPSSTRSLLLRFFSQPGGIAALEAAAAALEAAGRKVG